MRHAALKRILILASGLFACSACVSTAGSIAGASAYTKSDKPSIAPGQFGDEYAVQATIGTIKSRGEEVRISSRAIRLPERPLGEIAVYNYQFPSSCGGHEFRVLEANKLQILEYEFAGNDGASYTIRDYVTGPSPFVQPGLWSAYDHTADSISTMTTQFEMRGDRMFNGVYSQGLVTSLSVAEQRTLGAGYQRAVSDVYYCRDARTLVGSADK